MAQPGPNTAKNPASSRAMRHAMLLCLIVAAVRIAYLALLSPYELVGDEAQYWVWATHPQLSYYSKGPGVAWVIWGSTSLFGNTEWAVRLPAVLGGLVTMLSAAWLARRTLPGLPRAPMYAVGALLASPGLQVTSVLMTIDSPFVACWSVACCLTCALGERLMARTRMTSALFCAGLLGFSLGLGFLFKYTALLLVPSIVPYLWIVCRGRRARMGLAMLVAGVALLASMLPVVLWNAEQGWPTVKHLMGHLGMAGGDLAQADPSKATQSWSPMWTLEYLGAQVGVVGPAILLAAIATVRALRERRERDAVRARGDLLLMLVGWPIFVVYFFVSFATSTQGNWAIAGAFGLLVLVAREAAIEIPRYRALVAGWVANPARPRMGLIRRKPETFFQIVWHWSIGLGLFTAVAMTMLKPASRLPVVGDVLDSPVRRLSQSRELAARVQVVREELIAAHGVAPVIVASRYQTASLLSFYLPGNPDVSSGASWTGDRRSSHDLIDGLRLDDPALIGRPVLLVGTGIRAWERSALGFVGLVDRMESPQVQIAERYLGVVGADEESP